METTHDNWREKWQHEKNILDQTGLDVLVRQRELPEGDTRIRMLTYEPPVSVWTHWINNNPFHCNGNAEVLWSNRLDPDNCIVCRWLIDEGMNNSETKPKQTWLLPCAIKEGDNERFAVIEIGKSLYQNLARIAINKRNDILAADIIITKKPRGRGYVDYTAEIVEDTPMTPKEEEWAEDAYNRALELVPRLDEERFALLVNGELDGDPFSEDSTATTTIRKLSRPADNAEELEAKSEVTANGKPKITIKPQTQRRIGL